MSQKRRLPRARGANGQFIKRRKLDQDHQLGSQTQDAEGTLLKGKDQNQQTIERKKQPGTYQEEIHAKAQQAFELRKDQSRTQQADGCDDVDHQLVDRVDELQHNSAQIADLEDTVSDLVETADDLNYNLMLSVPEAFNPSKNKIIGYIDVLDEMHIEMDVLIHSFPTKWGSVFHCTTGQNWPRLPGIFLHAVSTVRVLVFR